MILYFLSTLVNSYKKVPISVIIDKITIINIEHMEKSPIEPVIRNPTEEKSLVGNLVYRALDLIFMALYGWVKLIFVPITFILNFAMSIIGFVAKIAKLGLTFVMNGIHGVQKTLRIGAFAEKIHYAVLKENGQYLKLPNKTL